MAHITSPLSFLRPLALPRSSTITSFFHSRRSLTTTSSTKSPSPIPLVRPAAAQPAEASQSPAAATLPLSNLPYRVLRTSSKSFPVYLLRKAGGNLLQTRIRKIEGDREAMLRDLDVALNLEKERLALRKRKNQKKGEPEQKLIWVNSVNGHIVVKGHRKTEIEKFLAERLF